MATDRARVETVFDAVLHRQTPAEREAYLEGACGSDAELREQVESLLLAHERAGHLLETAPLGLLDGHATPPHEGPGTRIGRYKLLQLIGEGGFGSVFMAEQEHPVRRKVALKIIKLGMDTKQVIARFEAERQALAMMDHPNIARVLDAGATETGRPYFAMELVRGVPITEYCDENNLTTPERLELFILVCRAVQHAHQKGIIHRDLKPSNVLVTLHDDKPVPKVIDFGIAKATQSRLTEKTLFTEYRQFIGTPQYMSPEQAQMSGLDVDTRSDVYSLGVLLYELLTGTTPIDASVLRSAAYDQVRQMIQEVEPPRPSTRLSTMGEALTKVAAHRRIDPAKLRKLVRGDLDWVVMKALEKDRTRRYETANGLAMDLQRYLRNESVSASPPGQWYALRKLVRRHKGVVAAVAAVVTALTLGMAVATFGMIRAVAARKTEATQRTIAEQHRVAADLARADAERARNDAIKARGEAELALASIYPSNGFRASDLGQNAVASLWFANAARLAGANTELGRLNARRSVWWAEMGVVPVAAVTLPGEWPLDVELHAEGRYLLAQTLGAGRDAGELPTWTLWDLYHEQPVPLPGGFGAVTAAAWNRDGKCLAIGNAAGEVRLLSFPSLDPVQSTRTKGPVRALTFPAQGAHLGVAAGAAAAVWDRASQEFVTPWLTHPAAVAAISFSPAGDRLLTACIDQNARVFAVTKEASAPLFAPMPHTMRPPAGAERSPVPLFFDEGRTVLTATATAVAWHDARDGSVTHTVDAPDGVRCLAGLGGRVAVGGADQVRVFSSNATLQRTVEQKGVTCAAFCPDERMLAMAAGPLVSTWWNRATQPRNVEFPAHASPVSCIAFSPDARLAVTAERGGLVRAWRLPKVQMVTSIPFEGGYSGARFSPDGKHVMPAGSNFALGDLRATRVYSVPGGEPAGPPIDVADVIRCGAFSPAGTQIALLVTSEVNDDSATLQLWDWQAGRRTASVRLAAFPESLSYGPDGKQVAVVCVRGESLLVDTASGEVRRRWASATVTPRGDLFNAASCFSPDGRTLITFDAESLVVRDTAGGDPRLPPLRCGAAWTGACFSPDGHRFATTSSDNELRVWETATGRQVSATMNNPATGDGVSFSPDGQLLMTTRGALSVWDWRVGRLLFPPDGHVAVAAWGSEGSIVAVRDQTVELLDGRTGAILRTLDGSQGRMLDVAPGATMATSLGTGGVIRILRLTTVDTDGGAAPVAADPCLFSELVSGHHISADGAVVSLTSREWVDRWRRSRAAAPADASPLARAAEQAVAYHRQKAADVDNGDAARAFHLDQLAAAGVATGGERILRARLWARLGKWDQAADALLDAIDPSAVDAAYLQDYADLLPAVGDSARAARGLEDLTRLAARRPTRSIVRGNWWALGPVPVDVIQGNPAPPNADARRTPTSLPAVPAGGEELRWRMMGNGQKLDLGRGVGIGHYVQSRLYSPDDRDVLFGIKLDDGGRLWLNGQKIYDTPRGWDKFTDLKVRLHAGWNTMLVAVVNRSGPHGIEVQISEDPVVWGRFYLDHPDDGIDKALPHLAEAIAAAPTDSEPYFIRAEALGRLGRFPEALADYRKGLELQPNNEWAWMNLALLRLYAGDLDGYRQTAREFLVRFRDARDPQAVEHMARVLAADPDPDPVLDREPLEQAIARVDTALSASSGTSQPFLLMAKGVAQYRAGKFSPAMDTLRRSGAAVWLPESQAIDALYMAMAQHRLRRYEQATALFDEASALIDTKLPKAGAADLGHVYHEWLLCQIIRNEAREVLRSGGSTTSASRPVRDWPAARRQRRADDIRLFTAQLQADPSGQWYYGTRAMVYARGGQFDQAIADWDEAKRLQPTDHLAWYLEGCALAWQEKTEAYRAHRSAMLARFSGQTDHDVAERTAKTALLMPIDAAELKTATTFIDFALSPGAGENAESWYPLAKAMAEYRAGEFDPTHYERAIDWLTRAKRRNRDDAFVATADFYLAMAHHRLGHADQATAALAAAVKRADAKLPQAGGDDLLAAGWVENWLICNVARREAERLVNGPTSQPATRP